MKKTKVVGYYILILNILGLVGSVCGVNYPRYIDWYRGPDFRKYTFYTDKCFEIEKLNPDSINIAWLLEPPIIDPKAYDYILKNYSKFNYVLTYDKEILSNVPNSYFIPGASTWIKMGDFKIYPKTKNVCLMASEKNEVEGHHLRYEIIEKLGGKVGPIYGLKNTKFENRGDIKKILSMLLKFKIVKKIFILLNV